MFPGETSPILVLSDQLIFVRNTRTQLQEIVAAHEERITRLRIAEHDLATAIHVLTLDIEAKHRLEKVNANPR